MTAVVQEKNFSDFLNREINIGDYVVFPGPYNVGMKLGKVIRFTPKKIRVEWTYKSYKGKLITTDTARISNQCVRVEGPDLFMYLLSGDY